jgi:hypothetical protein
MANSYNAARKVRTFRCNCCGESAHLLLATRRGWPGQDALRFRHQPSFLHCGTSVARLDLLYASVIFTRLLFGAICMAGVGGYLIWTDFIAPSLGIKTWED